MQCAPLRTQTKHHNFSDCNLCCEYENNGKLTAIALSHTAHRLEFRPNVYIHLLRSVCATSHSVRIGQTQAHTIAAQPVSFGNSHFACFVVYCQLASFVYTVSCGAIEL